MARLAGPCRNREQDAFAPLLQIAVVAQGHRQQVPPLGPCGGDTGVADANEFDHVRNVLLGELEDFEDRRGEHALRQRQQSFMVSMLQGLLLSGIHGPGGCALTPQRPRDARRRSLLRVLLDNDADGMELDTRVTHTLQRARAEPACCVISARAAPPKLVPTIATSRSHCP